MYANGIFTFTKKRLAYFDCSYPLLTKPTDSP